MAGGRYARWRRDGKELVYLSDDDGKLTAVAVKGRGAAFEVGAARPLFDVRQRVTGGGGFTDTVYDVSADGQRFLVNMSAEQPATSALTIVVNWVAGLRK